jgi:hypothetical protein
VDPGDEGIVKVAHPIRSKKENPPIVLHSSQEYCESLSCLRGKGRGVSDLSPNCSCADPTSLFVQGRRLLRLIA